MGDVYKGSEHENYGVVENRHDLKPAQQTKMEPTNVKNNGTTVDDSEVSDDTDWCPKEKQRGRSKSTI